MGSSCIYFAETLDGQYLKIGRTKSMARRFDALNCVTKERFGSGVRLLGACAGGLDKVAEILIIAGRIAEPVIGREWFRSDPVIIAGMMQHFDINPTQIKGFCQHGSRSQCKACERPQVSSPEWSGKHSRLRKFERHT